MKVIVVIICIRVLGSSNFSTNENLNFLRCGTIVVLSVRTECKPIMMASFHGVFFSTHDISFLSHMYGKE